MFAERSRMTAATDANWYDALIDVLDRQRTLYLQLDQLSQRQAELVRDQDTEGLLDVLSQRQALIDQLTQAAAQLEPFKQRWSDLWPTLDEHRQQELRQRMQQIQQLLERVMQRDDEDRQTLSDRRDQLGEQLNHTHRGAAANQAYSRAAAAAAANRFTDQTA